MKKLSVLVVMLMAFAFVNAQTKPAAKAPAKAATATAKVVLPQAINDNIAKDYAGFTVKNTKMVGDTYHVVVTKGATSETLIYDKAGKFVRKSEAKSGSAAPAKPAAKPAAKAPVKK
jgi:hypothetical protein